VRLESNDLWSYIGKIDAVCITTNGCIKKDGRAVMGKGIAAQALQRYPGLDETLGNYIGRYGNVPHPLHSDQETTIVSLPTKPGYEWCDDPVLLCQHMQRTKLPALVPGWAFKSTESLIISSLIRLNDMANHYGWKQIVLPMPGVGAGELDPSVALGLVHILDDRYIVIRR
jgi:hypothetical protein